MTVQKTKANIENLEKHFRNAKKGTALYEVLEVFVTLEDLCIAVESMEELEQYKSLGTVEELKEAREKQVAKKPILYGDSEDGKLLCPNCDEDLWDVKECGYNGCPYCLQAIDWEEGGTSD